MSELSKLINDLYSQGRDLIRGVLELSYFSRGAWTYTECMYMSAAEREIALEFINKRLEQAAKMPFPVF